MRHKADATHLTGQEPVSTGTCGAEPGVAVLLDWRKGKPVLDADAIAPPKDWVSYHQPTAGFTIRIPPDWTVLDSRTSPDASQPSPAGGHPSRPAAAIARLRLRAPDGNGLFEFVTGRIEGLVFHPQDSAVAAKRTLLGKEAKLTSICAYEDSRDPNLPTWFHADYVGEGILVSDGLVVALPSDFHPATEITYQNLIGARQQFEALVRSVFIPLLAQLPIGKFASLPE